MGERVRFWSRWPIVLWLTGVWVLFWGHLTVANVLAGLLLAVLLVSVAPMPRVGFEGRPSLPGMVVLLSTFAVELFLASIQVTRTALTFWRPPRGAVIRVRLRSHSDLLLTVTAAFCSLVPGSIVVEAHRLTGTLYLHVLDIARPADLDRARERVLVVERRVMYAFASAGEIEEAGLPPRRRLLRRRPAQEVSA